MWPHTKMTTLLGVALPLIQAPMAGDATTPELIAAVCNAGGLGSLGAGYMQPAEIKRYIHNIRRLTDKPFAVNLFVPQAHHATPLQIESARDAVQTCCAELEFTLPMISPPYAASFEEQMQVLLAEDISIFSFTFGMPERVWIEKFKHKGVILIGTATTPAEAQALKENGIDIICLQGWEAGGHRGSFLDGHQPPFMELSSLLASVNSMSIPFVAAGGIMDAHDIVQALSHGAEGVQMGSAFLCCLESGIHPQYKNLLLSSIEDNTVLTRAFSGKWARGIKNEFITRMLPYEETILDYPIQHALTIAMRKEARKQGTTGFMSLWAGQSAYLCKALPVSTLIQEINAEVSALYGQ